MATMMMLNGRMGNESKANEGKEAVAMEVVGQFRTSQQEKVHEEKRRYLCVGGRINDEPVEFEAETGRQRKPSECDLQNQVTEKTCGVQMLVCLPNERKRRRQQVQE